MGQFSVKTARCKTAFFYTKDKKREKSERQRFEHQKQQLNEECRKLELERKEFEKEKQDFYIKKKSEHQRAVQEKRLFEMKWKILEEELRKLAAEKEQIARQRDFYRYVNLHETEMYCSSPAVKGELFFRGVRNEKDLKKRYKDLIKIYHPDNQSGDKGTLQTINDEFERLKLLFTKQRITC